MSIYAILKVSMYVIFEEDVYTTFKIKYFYITQNESLKVKWMFVQDLRSIICAILEVNFSKLKGCLCKSSIKYLCNTQNKNFKVEWMFIQHPRSSMCAIFEVNFLKLNRCLSNIKDVYL